MSPRKPAKNPAAVIREMAALAVRRRKKNPAAVALGRLGGKANKGRTSDAKAAAARENGKRGGRPRKKPVTPDVDGGNL
jgi:hypothetical protein